MMMTSVRMVSPIIETPSRMPDAKATTAVTDMTVGRITPVVAAEQEEGDAFEQPRLRDDRDEERQAEDEQHRVGVDQIVEAAERQQVLPDPGAPAVLRDLDVPRGGRQPAERRDDDEQHAVGQRILVDLIPEGAEEEEPEDRRQHLGRQQPERHRRRSGRRRAMASGGDAQRGHERGPGSITTAAAADRSASSRIVSSG